MENPNEWQYVAPSGRGKQRHRGYWRRAAVTWQEPTPAQAAQRLRMSVIANRFAGTKGTIALSDGTKIPINSVFVGSFTQGSPDLENLPQPPAPPSPPPRRLTLEERLYLAATPQEREQMLRMRQLAAILGH